MVSTSVGAEGLDLIPDTDLLLADTPETFAQETVRLLGDPALRATLAAHGRQTVTTQYDWDCHWRQSCFRSMRWHAGGPRKPGMTRSIWRRILQ